jgi:hypothetical protein
MIAVGVYYVLFCAGGRSLGGKIPIGESGGGRAPVQIAPLAGWKLRLLRRQNGCFLCDRNNPAIVVDALACVGECRRSVILLVVRKLSSATLGNLASWLVVGSVIQGALGLSRRWRQAPVCHHYNLHHEKVMVQMQCLH